MVRLVGSSGLASLKKKRIQLRGGPSDAAARGLGYWRFSSLPAVVTAAIVHRATSRG